MTQQEQDLEWSPMAQRPHGQLAGVVERNGGEGRPWNLTGSAGSESCLHCVIGSGQLRNLPDPNSSVVARG